MESSAQDKSMMGRAVTNHALASRNVKGYFASLLKYVGVAFSSVFMYAILTSVQMQPTDASGMTRLAEILVWRVILLFQRKVIGRAANRQSTKSSVSHRPNAEMRL